MNEEEKCALCGNPIVHGTRTDSADGIRKRMCKRHWRLTLARDKVQAGEYTDFRGQAVGDIEYRYHLVRGNASEQFTSIVETARNKSNPWQDGSGSV